MIKLTLQEFIVWIITGTFAGMLSGLLLRKKGSRFVNLIIGLIGAVIGGLLCGKLKLNLIPENISIDLDNLVSATIGAIIFIVVIRGLHKLWNYIFKKMDESLEHIGD